MPHNHDAKMEDALREHLLPGEDLRGYVLGIEQPNVWLHLFLLGPVAGAIATRSYYMGLTNRRVLFASLSRLTAKPTGETTEILLGRIISMEYKKGRLNGSLKICYGEDFKRRFMISRRELQNAKRLVDIYELLPKPTLNEQEMEMARAAETAHREEINSRMGLAFIVLLLLVFFMLALTFGGRPY